MLTEIYTKQYCRARENQQRIRSQEQISEQAEQQTKEKLTVQVTLSLTQNALWN